jgi:GAF domain-containing protein
MRDEPKTKEQLIDELVEMRQRIAELEAVDTERKRAEEEIKQRNEELAALNTIAAAVSQSLDLKEILDAALGETLAVLNVERGLIYLFNETSQTFAPAVHRGISQDVLREVTGFKMGEGLSGRVAQLGEALVVADLGADPRNISPASVRAGWHSYASVPIKSRGKVLGVMTLTTPQDAYFRPDHVGLLNHIGNQVGVAIENALLYQNERRRAVQLAVVNQTAQRAALILDMDQLLQEVVAAIQQGFNYHNVTIDLLDEAAGELEMLAVAGGFADMIPPGYRQAVGMGMVGWVAETGQPLLANDVSQEPRYILGFLEEPLTKSELCVPLKLAGQVIGVLDVQDTRLNAFDEMDLMAMETLADQLAVAIENARLYEAVQRELTERKRAEEEIQQRTAQLEALQQVSLGLAAQLELDTLLRSIVARAVALLEGAEGSLYLYRPERDVLESVMSIGPHLAPTGSALHRGEGLAGKVWESGEPLIVEDYQHWEGRAAAYEGYPFTSVVGVPIRWGEESLGVLNVNADPARIFSPADAELLSLFATQAAIAIENARLFEGEQAQRELSKALEEAATAVSSTLDLEQVLDRILEQVERVVAGDAFSVILIEEDGAHLARWRGYELPGEKTQLFRFEIPIAKYPNLMKMARTGEPVVVLDTSVDPNWVPAARDQGWRRSYVGAPIQVGGVTVGFLNVSSTQPGQFGPDDAQRLQAFASHAATAIENACLFQAEREQRELAEALAEAAAAVGSTLDLDQVLSTVLEEARRLLDVVACSVWLIEPGTDELICRQAVGPQSEIVRGWRLALGEGLVGWVARSGESLIVPDTWADERHFKGVDQQTGLALRSILSVPLRSKKDLIGVLQVVDTEVDRFSLTDLGLLEPLAASAAIAIENAQLYEQARRDAELKTTLLNEVNHRVQNNLAAIIGLLYAERRHIGMEDQAAYQSIMQDLVNRVQGLSTVHSLLSASEWTPLRLSKLATQVIHSSLRALPRGKRVSVDVSASPVRVTSDQAHNLALVINELTTNTVKHALQERDTGHITVHIALEDATVLFEFRDDGPGHPKEVLQLEHHTVGFDLIQTLVRHGLRGEVTLHNDHGAVTIVRFKTME